VSALEDDLVGFFMLSIAGIMVSNSQSICVVVVVVVVVVVESSILFDENVWLASAVNGREL
jgi:hypothetical protein